MIEAFAGGADTEQTIAAYRGDGDARQLVDVLVAHAVLVEPDDDERDAIWPFVPIKGKWNVWHRNGERLVLWTAWGTRPITHIMLDPEETAMWDAFDGEKRLNELNALMSVVQSEAENLFVSTAASVRGVQTGAASFNRRGGMDLASDELDAADPANEIEILEEYDGDDGDTEPTPPTLPTAPRVRGGPRARDKRGA